MPETHIINLKPLIKRLNQYFSLNILKIYRLYNIFYKRIVPISVLVLFSFVMAIIYSYIPRDEIVAIAFLIIFVVGTVLLFIIEMCLLCLIGILNRNDYVLLNAAIDDIIKIRESNKNKYEGYLQYKERKEIAFSIYAFNYSLIHILNYMRESNALRDYFMAVRADFKVNMNHYLRYFTLTSYEEVKNTLKELKDMERANSNKAPIAKLVISYNTLRTTIENRLKDDGLSYLSFGFENTLIKVRVRSSKEILFTWLNNIVKILPIILIIVILISDIFFHITIPIQI